MTYEQNLDTEGELMNSGYDSGDFFGGEQYLFIGQGCASW